MEQLATHVRTKKGASGVLVIHSAPAALCSHIEWAIQSIVSGAVSTVWKTQPHCAGTFRTTITYRDRIGLAAKLASALQAWHYLRFEITESDQEGGELFRYIPELGLHRAVIDGSGSVIVDENRILHAMATSFDEESLRERLENIVGTPWDQALEMIEGPRAPAPGILDHMQD